MLIYDCEIKKAILGKNEFPIQHIEYCEGWRDFKNMGISCIGAYDYWTDAYRMFCEDNFKEFQALIDKHDTIVGFNSNGFDSQLCAANGIIIPGEKSYDILVEVWRGAGLGEFFNYPSHIGFGLDAICKVNFGIKKTGNGAHAPVDWQRGRVGSVIDYCLNDVKMTRCLVDQIDAYGEIKDPRYPTRKLQIRRPPI